MIGFRSVNVVTKKINTDVVSVLREMADQIENGGYNLIFDQFTGMADANNVDIYEGDILECEVIQYDQKKLAYIVVPPKEYLEDDMGSYFGYEFFDKTHRVVGNVHLHYVDIDGLKEWTFPKNSTKN